MRRAVTLALLICCAGARVARADSDGGVAPASAASPAAAQAAPDAAASQPGEPSVVAPPGEAGPGLFEQSNAAVAAPSAPAEPAPAAAGPFTLNGYVRGDMFAGKVSGADAAELKSGYGEMDLTLRTRKEPYGDGFAEARVRYGLQGDQTQGTVVELREAYVNAYLGPFDLRLGQQIIVWGRADALNPTNNLTPVDFRIRSPLEDDIRLGNAGARAFLRFAPFRLEGVWMPIYLPTELPAVALPQYVSYGAPAFPVLPPANLKNGTEGARLHLELPAFDMSISYVHGLALLPGLTMTGLSLTADVNGNPNPTAPPSILISRTAYEQQVLGVDFSTTLGEFGTLRGEAAYRRPYDWAGPVDHHIAYPDLQYVLGADHTFGSLSVILQYMGRYVFDWQKQSGPAGTLDTSVLPTLSMANSAAAVTNDVNSVLAKMNQILFSQTAQLQHLATLRLEWLALHETLSVSSLCLLNFTTHEWLVTPRIGYRLSDAMTAYVGAQVFHGPTDTLFGIIDAELSSGYAELRYTF
ncbi:MAG TPA: DUF1302 family protein [Polyangia bacterium]|jgi:hypothetical protein|nr:DUF1302 family protein [Polyangia bacterium]